MSESNAGGGAQQAPPDDVIVYTVGKTGTKSAYVALDRFFRMRFPDQPTLTRHTHWLSRDEIERLNASAKLSEKWAERARGVRQIVSDLADAGRRSIVFSFVRNPLNRVMSDFFYRFPRLSQLYWSLAPEQAEALRAELNEIFALTVDYQIRKEEKWWEAFNETFGFRLRDVPEIKSQGFAIREGACRTAVVVLKLEKSPRALRLALDALGYSGGKLKMAPRNCSDDFLSADAVESVRRVLDNPSRPLCASPCYKDWRAAYGVRALMGDREAEKAAPPSQDVAH